MILDNFLTINAPSEGEYKEKGSKFLAYTYPFSNDEQLPLILQEIRTKHPKARHFCYAYKLGLDNDNYRINDDGEPSGTAGKPIYGQILSHELTNVLVVVVRYFGGTKLGASGLIHAYKEAAKDALNQAEIVTKYLFKYYTLEFSYEHMGHIMNAIKECNIEILDKNFADDCQIKIGLRLSEIHKKLLELKARILQISEEEITWEAAIDFCKIEAEI